jgi:selenocysteine lyase/cysteine desulfurase
MEHHSNIVPWQILCEEKQAILRIAPINQRGELLLDEFEKLLNPRTKLVSVVHVSNASAPSTRWRRSRAWRTATARLYSSTARRPWPI